MPKFHGHGLAPNESTGFIGESHQLARIKCVKPCNRQHCRCRIFDEETITLNRHVSMRLTVLLTIVAALTTTGRAASQAQQAIAVGSPQEVCVSINMAK
jgi:hypothetical protein